MLQTITHTSNTNILQIGIIYFPVDGDVIICMPAWVEFLDEMKELFSVSDGPKLRDLQLLLARAPEFTEGFRRELEKCTFLHCVIDNWQKDGINVEIISALLDFFPGFANVYARYTSIDIDQHSFKFIWTVNGVERAGTYDSATYPLHLACKIINALIQRSSCLLSTHQVKVLCALS